MILASLALTPVGILLAVTFSVGLAATMGWMLRVPPPAPRGATSALRSVQVIHKVLVPLVDLGASVRAVELACRLGMQQHAELVLAYVYEIPLTSPLRVPEQDPKVQRAMAAAAFIASQHGLLPRQRVEPARQAWTKIVDIAREENADLIVMGVTATNRPNESPMGRVADNVVRRAHCEVIVDRVPMERVPSIPT
jgi:nucleotide-binding universal stress UspA family protein